MRSRSLICSLMLLPLVAACAAEATAADPTDGSDDVELVAPADLKADRAAGTGVAALTATYYDVVRDTRKCVAPGCGGYWVSRLNFKTTKCHDGVARSSCYVESIDVENGLGLSADEAAGVRADLDAHRIVLRGTIKSTSFGTQTLGVFAPTEAWRSATAEAPSGIVYKVSDRHIQCIAAPCPTFEQAKLNSTIVRKLEELDLSGVGVDESLVNAAFTALADAPLLVAGTNETFTIASRSGTSLAATQYWTRVAHAALSAYTPAARDLAGLAYGDLLVAQGTYPRVYRFGTDGTVTVEDRVATCPAGAMCIWSGVVTRAATWTVAGDNLALAWIGGATPASYTDTLRYFSTLLVRKDASGRVVLLERADDGSVSGRAFRP